MINTKGIVRACNNVDAFKQIRRVKKKVENFLHHNHYSRIDAYLALVCIYNVERIEVLILGDLCTKDTVYPAVPFAAGQTTSHIII